MTEEQVLNAVGRQIEGMRAAGYDRSETLSTEVVAINATTELQTAEFVRLRADGSELGRWLPRADPDSGRARRAGVEPCRLCGADRAAASLHLSVDDVNDCCVSERNVGQELGVRIEFGVYERERLSEALRRRAGYVTDASGVDPRPRALPVC